jgi:hypothetical protein
VSGEDVFRQRADGEVTWVAMVYTYAPRLPDLFRIVWSQGSWVQERWVPERRHWVENRALVPYMTGRGDDDIEEITQAEAYRLIELHEAYRTWAP